MTSFSAVTVVRGPKRSVSRINLNELFLTCFTVGEFNRAEGRFPLVHSGLDNPRYARVDQDMKIWAGYECRTQIRGCSTAPLPAVDRSLQPTWTK
jgi:hypothetical protein